MAALFSTTLFLSAALLFWVEPLVAKMLLPLLGGAPSVWNTCMVFFQTMLLAGYAYAHLLSTRLTVSRQITAHGCLVALTALSLPIGISEKLVHSLSSEANPFLWLLGALFVVVGLPFFVLAGTGPLLQKWFSLTRHGAAEDPYFLYSASNLGSLLALLAYPVLFEPHLRLRQQSALWAAGYVGLTVFLLLCGGLTLRLRARGIPARTGNLAPPEGEQGFRSSGSIAGEIRSGRRRLRWLAFAFVPSSLMLGITTYLATDIASIPLLWIVPLSIYLFSFILVFARRQMVPMSWLRWLLPVVALGVVFQILTRGTHPVWMV